MMPTPTPIMAMPRATGDPIVPIPPATKLSYEQSNLLMGDISFRGRIKVACLTFAKYIANEEPSQPAHNSRLRWSRDTMQQPDQAAQQAQPNTVMQDLVQAQGSAISDKDLQAAVETAVGNLL